MPNATFGPARWVWSRDAADCNAYVDFFQSFASRATGAQVLRICADSQYVAYLNGQLVGFGQYADYPFHHVYDELDISPYVKNGDNELVIHGYCQVTDGFTCRCGEPGVIFAILDNDKPLAVSGVDTLCRPSPTYRSGAIDQISPQLRYAFEHDATQADSLNPWIACKLLEPQSSFHLRPIEKLSLMPRKRATVLSQGIFSNPPDASSLGQRMQYAALSFREFFDMTGRPAPQSLPSEAGLTFEADGGDGIYLLLDLLEEDAGLLDIELALDAPTELLLGWGEHTTDLRVRAFRDGRNFAARHVAPAGRSAFTHYFKRIGGRYVQLHIAAPRVTLYYAGMRPTVYPLSDAPIFKTHHALHKKIYEVSKRTLAACMHEHYEDSPWREQALYSMDSRNQMLFGYYAFGEYRFPRASLELMALSLRKDNMLEICSPATGSITIPSFSAIFPVQLQEYYLFSGDEAFARQTLPVARHILDGFLGQLNAQGLIPTPRAKIYWNFYEWQTGLDGHTSFPQDDQPERVDAPLNCFVALALDRFARMLRSLGNESEAEHYHRQCDQLRKAIHYKFWQPIQGVYATYANDHSRWHECELSQALAVCAGVCPEDALDGLLLRLTDGSLLPVTLSHSVFLYDAVMRRPVRYGQWVFEKVETVFGNMLYQGATTFWETERGSWDFNNAGSLCHGWSAVPVYLYYAYALGLRPTAPGFADYTIQPAPHPLGEVSGRVRLASGAEIVLSTL